MEMSGRRRGSEGSGRSAEPARGPPPAGPPPLPPSAAPHPTPRSPPHPPLPHPHPPAALLLRRAARRAAATPTSDALTGPPSASSHSARDSLRLSGGGPGKAMGAGAGWRGGRGTPAHAPAPLPAHPPPQYPTTPLTGGLAPFAGLPLRLIRGQGGLDDGISAGITRPLGHGGRAGKGFGGCGRVGGGVVGGEGGPGRAGAGGSARQRRVLRRAMGAAQYTRPSHQQRRPSHPHPAHLLPSAPPPAMHRALARSAGLAARWSAARTRPARALGARRALPPLSLRGVDRVGGKWGAKGGSPGGGRWLHRPLPSASPPAQPSAPSPSTSPLAGAHRPVAARPGVALGGARCDGHGAFGPRRGGVVTRKGREP